MESLNICTEFAVHICHLGWTKFSERQYLDYKLQGQQVNALNYKT